MNPVMQQFIRRLERLPAAVQERFVRRFLRELEEDLPAAYQDTAQMHDAERVPFDRIKHLAGIIKGGPSDASSNKKYLEGFGERSL
ncbi:MAG: hypothetical protein KatS3mg042_0238 [Rhodothermaceae bacterium]|nr:MAG: hypothetical protein KatS3mg042_0238 [Rhodothermaceae bacterium]